MRYRVGDRVKTKDGKVGWVDQVMTWKDVVLVMEEHAAIDFINRLKTTYGKSGWDSWCKVLVMGKWYDERDITPQKQK